VGILFNDEIRYFVPETPDNMFNRKLTQSDIFIIAANLLPVYGVWFLGWPPVEAFTVYAMETMIVGIMTVLKLLVCTLAKGSDEWSNNGTVTKMSGFFFIFFFIVHFGLFALVQTSIFAETAKIGPPGSGMFHFFFNWYKYITTEIGYMLLAFIIGYLAKSFIPFLLNGDYKKQPMMLIMFMPYGRIFVQQFTVILGSMFLSLGAGKVFILIFVLAKLAFELLMNFEELLKKTTAQMNKEKN
jgi:Family of unknown function (DUF6498)